MHILKSKSDWKCFWRSIPPWVALIKCAEVSLPQKKPRTLETRRVLHASLFTRTHARFGESKEPTHAAHSGSHGDGFCALPACFGSLIPPPYFSLQIGLCTHSKSKSIFRLLHSPAELVFVPAVPLDHRPASHLLQLLQQRLQTGSVDRVLVHARAVQPQGLLKHLGGGLLFLLLVLFLLQDVPELLLQLVVDQAKVGAGGAVVRDADLDFE